MNPFIFQFKEKATGEDMDYSKIVYNNDLNINVHRDSGEPAIGFASMGTRTNVKSPTGSDNDFGGSLLSMSTITGTFDHAEVSDSDKDKMGISMLMGTVTNTRNLNELSDKDPY